MKIFNNKKMLFKLIVALCIFLTLTSVAMPTKVQASWLFETGKGALETGGKLLSPIIDLVLALGDAVIDILQEAVMGTESIITIKPTLKTILGYIAVVFATVTAFAAVIFLGAALAALIPLIASVGSGVIGVLAIAGAAVAYVGVSGAVLPDIVLLPTYSISPEEIFRGDILLFDVNIFNPKELYVKVEKDGNVQKLTATQWNSTDTNGNYTNSYRNSGYEVVNYYYYKDGNSNNNEDNNIIPTSANNSAFELRSVVANWYYIIRNIALIGLMLILVYVGIRIMISSTASEKSKYKQMLGDWVVAMCLIFVMQYIMIFANNLTEAITKIFANVSKNEYHMVNIVEPDAGLIEAVKELGLEKTVQGKNIVWQTNLMGKARILAQEQNGTSGYVGYALCFLVLVIYTIIFTVTYAKRLLYIIFFTIISPLVALTYPLDKINDGKAQAFNMWLREYIFNLLIQPFHLLLYTVLISTAFDLAGTNIIYTLVAIGFMTPAEKFLRKMFGFDKAGTPGFLDGASGAALTMHGLHSLEKIAGRGPGGKKQQGNNGSSDNEKVDFMNRGSSYKTDELLGRIGGNNSSEQTQDSEQGSTSNTTVDSSEDNENQTDAQRMFDADEENGAFDDDPEYRETLAREAYSPTPGGMYDEMSDEEFRNSLEEDGMDDETIALAMAVRNGNQQEIQPNSEPETEDFDIAPERSSTTQRISRPTAKQYLGAKARMFGRGVVDGYSRENFKKSLNTSINTAGKIAGLAAGGMIGAASDIASGTFGKNTTKGLVAGEAIGTGVSNMATGAIANAEKRHEETLKEIYGDQYSEYMKQKKDDMFIKDRKMREMYSREFSSQLAGLDRTQKKEKLDEIMNSAVEYRKYGITDNERIIKAMKMDGGNQNNWTDPERIAAARFSQSVKSEKDLDSVIKRYESAPGISKAQAETMRKRIRRINNDVL